MYLENWPKLQLHRDVIFLTMSYPLPQNSKRSAAFLLQKAESCDERELKSLEVWKEIMEPFDLALKMTNAHSSFTQG